MRGEGIYRVIAERKTGEGTRMDAATAPPLIPALQNDFPHIAAGVRFLNFDNPSPLVTNGPVRFFEKDFFFADASVFDVFTVPLVEGDPHVALQRPNTIVVSQEVALKYFGEGSALGKRLTVNNVLNLEVTGVTENPPENSTLQFGFLASFPTIEHWLGKPFVDNWQNNTCQSYVLLSAPVESVEPQLAGFVTRYVGESNSLKMIHLQPLHRIHLFSFQDFGLASGGDIKQVYLLAAVAAFILLISCVNYVNLSTTRLVVRSREVGVRKLIGADRLQILIQFLWEAGLVVVIAVILAVITVEISLPYLQSLFGNGLAAGFSKSWWMWLGPIAIVTAVGLFAGAYPAFVFSSLLPMRIAEGGLGTGSRRAFLRKALVVLQFAFTIALIIATWVVRDQLEFIEKKGLGFDKNSLVVAPIRDESLRQHPEALKNRLLQQPGISRVAGAALLPGGPVGRTRFLTEGQADPGTMSMLWVDQDFLGTFGIPLVAGRDFFKDRPTDASQAFILNEEAVRQIGWQSPEEAIGKYFEIPSNKKGTVIGVARDFHVASLRGRIDPLVLHLWPWLNYLVVQIDSSRSAGVLEEMKAIWGEFDPQYPFTYSFLAENFGRSYRSDEQLGRIFSLFALLAMIIACSGLFSLSASITEQRTKEIGIRRVLGASVLGVTGLLTREFAFLVLGANILAWPLASVAMNAWLQNFAFRITPGAEIFLLAGIGTFVLALSAMLIQAIKAATANPVESLRYE